jgi:hypothetical protein
MARRQNSSLCCFIIHQGSNSIQPAFFMVTNCTTGHMDGILFYDMMYAKEGVTKGYNCIVQQNAKNVI